MTLFFKWEEFGIPKTSHAYLCRFKNVDLTFVKKSSIFYVISKCSARHHIMDFSSKSQDPNLQSYLLTDRGGVEQLHKIFTFQAKRNGKSEMHGQIKSNFSLGSPQVRTFLGNANETCKKNSRKKSKYHSKCSISHTLI